jgi:hypothetical protein
MTDRNPPVDPEEQPVDPEDQSVLALAAQPLDAEDAAVLDELAQLLEDADPVPADLVSRVQFALALDEVYAEVAQITRVPLDALATRADQGVSRAETLTFTARRLSVMVTVSRTGADRVRVDGWVTPPLATEVRVRMQEDERQGSSDETGRFVLADLPAGFAQLVFTLPAEGEEPPEVVVTPVFEL